MAGMFKITFLPEDKSGEVSEGETVLEAAERLGVASCSTCRIRVSAGSGSGPVLSNIEVDEREVLEREQLDGDYRLACQARVKGDVTVVIPPPVKPLADKALPQSR